MKRVFRIALAIVLALVLTVQTPLQALAQAAAEEGPDYISEVKVFMGGSAESELKAEGFIPLKGDDGKPVDLNQGATGDGWGAPDNKKVLLGYKTTKRQSEAITDLAVMNMEGGYDVREYDALMKRYMGGQISPFLDRFLVAINEFRENLESDDDVNLQRAEYIRAALNKFTDDDCGGAGLGDLLENETVYEMAKPQFDALSEKDKGEIGIAGVNEQVRDALPAAKKNQHCDLLTLFAQADGQVMLVIYDLITRGADTNENSWMERFAATSYDELLESYEMPEEDALRQMARDFEDDARLLLANWNTFRTQLAGAEDDAVTLEGMEAPDFDAIQAKIDALNENSSSEEVAEVYSELARAQATQAKMLELAANISVADYLQNIDYDDGTMYDFFTRSSGSFSSNLQELYPLVASLSEGQRAGLEFISLRELVMLSDRDAEYAAEDIEELEPTSVYEGVDRGIYQKGGVGLTSDTLRSDALEREKNLADRSLLSKTTVVLWVLTGVSAAASIGLFAAHKGLDVAVKRMTEAVNQYELDENLSNASFFMHGGTAGEEAEAALDLEVQNRRNFINGLSSTSEVAAWMSAGFAVAMLILASVSVYLTWRDMKDYYKVDFAVIPHYMVDEASITYYNSNHELMVDIDYAAYYKAVTCNRSKDDKNHEALTDCADLNGDVGQQWVALYACRDNRAMPPILADSLKAVVGSTGVPAGYSKGIHMFGSDSAFNMNNKLYVWGQKAKPVSVYYKLDMTAPLSEPRTTGSAFSGGMLALTGIGGLALGALITALSMTGRKKKKNDPAAA